MGLRLLDQLATRPTRCEILECGATGEHQPDDDSGELLAEPAPPCPARRRMPPTAIAHIAIAARIRARCSIIGCSRVPSERFGDVVREPSGAAGGGWPGEPAAGASFIARASLVGQGTASVCARSCAWWKARMILERRAG
jgi:hypothetical protein